MASTYIKSLAKEYLDAIDALSSGMYSSAEMRDLEQQRGVLHAQLEAAINKRIRKDDMPRYARELLR